MFVLPDFWWLLALAFVPQLIFLGFLGARKARGREVANASMPAWAVILLSVGAAIGCLYGLMQSDWVFLLGQTCVLVIAFVRIRQRPKEAE